MRAAKPLLALAGAALIGVMLWKLDRTQLWTALVRMGPAALWTIPFGLAGMFSNVLTLRALVPARLPLGGMFANRFISDSYNNLLPLLGFGGEPFKMRFLMRFVTAEQALAATVQERIIDGVVDFGYAAVQTALGAALLTLEPPGRELSWAGAALSGVLGIGALVTLLTPLPARLLARMGRSLGGAENQATAASRAAQLRAGLWNLAGRLVGILEIWVLLRALGLPAPLLACCFIQGTSSVVGTLSWPIPGSIGATEAGTVLVFAWLGLPAADGMAFALVRRARQLLVSSCGVALYAAERRRR